MDGLIAVTYRCNAHCVMCNTWCNPSQPADEITAADLRSLPSLEFANVTGGEPFMRDDLADLVEVLVGKAKRVVVSTNGYYTDRVLALAREAIGDFLRTGEPVEVLGQSAAADGSAPPAMGEEPRCGFCELRSAHLLAEDRRAVGALRRHGCLAGARGISDHAMELWPRAQ